VDRLKHSRRGGKSGLSQKQEVGLRMSLLKFAVGSKSGHGKNQTESRVRLVGPICNRDSRLRVLFLGIR
jgi:hypothetical protein